MAAFNYVLFLFSFMILFPIFMSRTVSAIRICRQLTPSKSSSEEGAANNPNMLAVHKVPPQESHGIAVRVLMKGQITPSGPSHRGNAAPIFTRHLLRKADTLSFQQLNSVPSPGIGHR